MVQRSNPNDMLDLSGEASPYLETTRHKTSGVVPGAHPEYQDIPVTPAFRGYLPGTQDKDQLNCYTKAQQKEVAEQRCLFRCEFCDII